jgi:hypothetical protein
MAKGLDIHSARAVIAVCEEGNYSRAARRENVTQPAIRQQTNHLKADIGIQLIVYAFHRRQYGQGLAEDQLLRCNRGIREQAE